MNIKRSTSNVQLPRGRGTAEGLKGRAYFARTLRRPREERSQKHVFLRNEPELIWQVFECIYQNDSDLERRGDFFESGSFGKNEATLRGKTTVIDRRYKGSVAAGDGREDVIAEARPTRLSVETECAVEPRKGSG